MKYEWNIPPHAAEEGTIHWVQEDLNISWWFLITGHIPCFHDQQHTHDGSWTEGSWSDKLLESHVSSVPFQKRCEEWHMHQEAGEWNGVIAGFLSFMKRYGKEVFLYLEDPVVEKTSDIAEQHFSIHSWLFKHRFKTKEGLLRTSFWYHHYLSTGNWQYPLSWIYL